jgi:hypothetical protein
MGWLDSLFSNLPSVPQTQTGVESPWLRPMIGVPSSAPSGQGSLGTASQGPALLDRLAAGATNLTTGGNPVAGLLNAVNGLATGERTDRAGLELAMQHATMSALMNAGLDLRTARAAAIHPEFLRALVVKHYGARRGPAGTPPRTDADAGDGKEAAPADGIGGNVAPQAFPTADVGKAGR